MTKPQFIYPLYMCVDIWVLTILGITNSAAIYELSSTCLWWTDESISIEHLLRRELPGPLPWSIFMDQVNNRFKADHEKCWHHECEQKTAKTMKISSSAGTGQCHHWGTCIVSKEAMVVNLTWFLESHYESYILILWNNANKVVLFFPCSNPPICSPFSK